MSQSVYVGLSGGVDSSVAAALLKDQGFDVTGVYMKNWTQDLPGMICPWAEDLADAKRVAVQLGIPFKVYDFQDQYRHKVVDYMIAEYRAGRTPNPDIMCNQDIKFKLFLDTALADGADMIATGHYARTQGGQLLRAVDEVKDQTYFLYRVISKALQHTLFPLGNLTKAAVREIAERRGLVTAQKKDSQGICFVGKVGIREFLSHYVNAVPGDIIDTVTHKIIGRHDGAIFYTIGQRQGLGVGGGLPYYVTGKDMARDEVYVTTRLNDASLWRAQLQLTDTHWITEPPHIGDTLQARLRHRGRLIAAEVTAVADDELTLQLEDAERAITPGQSTVLYEGDRVVGGGIVLH